jgi:hypothetical protein
MNPRALLLLPGAGSTGGGLIQQCQAQKRGTFQRATGYPGPTLKPFQEKKADGNEKM